MRSASGTALGVRHAADTALTPQRVPAPHGVLSLSGLICTSAPPQGIKGVCSPRFLFRPLFSLPPLILSFFLRKCQARPIRAHTCSGIARRLCGGLGASVAQGLRALRLWQSSRQWRAVPWSCIDAEPGCRALRRSSVNILTAWPGRVAQAPRAWLYGRLTSSFDIEVATALRAPRVVCFCFFAGTQGGDKNQDDRTGFTSYFLHYSLA